MIDHYRHRRSLFGRMVLQTRTVIPVASGAPWTGVWRDAKQAEANEYQRHLHALSARVDRAEKRAKAQKDARVLKQQTAAA